MFYTYGVLGMSKLILDKLNTIIFYSKARIIRRPLIIRGKRNIDLGKSLTTGVGCRLEAYPKEKNRNKDTLIKFGENVEINDYVHITAMNSVTIGNNVLMASKIYISDCSHGFYEGDSNDSSPKVAPNKRKYKMSSVVIENNVWLGEFVSVLPGVTIGEGSIIGSNSVVTKSIPPNSIAVGIPAKVIKEFDFEIKRWKKIN
jgi:lipopolysaccharide O-acetyltransferase